MAEESELVVDPAMFHGLHPEIGHVTVDLKRGTVANELPQFRYDVTLRRERAAQGAVPEKWLD